MDLLKGISNCRCFQPQPTGSRMPCAGHDPQPRLRVHTCCTALSHVPAHQSHCVDMQVALVSLETFAVVPLPAARGAVALAVQHTQHLPVLLAVATKHGKGKSKVLVFNVLPGANVTGGHQPAVLVAQVWSVAGLSM